MKPPFVRNLLFAQIETLFKAVHASAGVDHLPASVFASDVPLCRVVDEDFRHGMFEYALWGVLWFQRRFDRALAHQRERVWKMYPQRAAADYHVGVMGLGEIGGYIADQLARLGYRVSGWSRSEKQLAGVTCYRGEEALDSFLGSLDGLINLLPLTAQTRGILAAQLFNRLPAGAVLINCGRGEHMVNEDVLAALESGQLAGAVLDVFPQEPLPADDPLWRHPQVVITPHMASAAPAEVIARQLLENIQRQRRGLPLKNTEENLTWMTQTAQKAGAKVLLVGMQVPPNYGTDYANKFAGLFTSVAQAHKAAVVPFF